MLSPNEARDRCEALLRRAQAAGAASGDALYLANTSQSVTVRLGALEDVERSESSIGSSDLGDAALDELAQRAVAMARLAPPDPFAGLADAALLLRNAPPELDLDDGGEAEPQHLRTMAERIEAAAMAVPGVTNSNGGSASSGRSVFALATSHGFAGAYAASSHGVSASVVAGEGSTMQRDYAYASRRHAADLPDIDSIGRQAGERTTRRLNPGRMRSGPMSVVFDPRVGASLVGHLIGAMNGAAIARRASFLLDRDGAKLFDSAVTILNDPHIVRGLRSRPFDGEGLQTAAGALGKAPTGHAGRGGSGAPHVTTGNVVLAPGPLSPAALIADIGEGVYVTELIGSGVNGVTGDYSRGASGYRITGGVIGEPIAEFTVAGNLIDMFAALVPASDLERIYGIDVPTLRIDGMTVAGD